MSTSVDGAATAEVPGPARLPALLRLMRPKQWLKNVLVLAAPGAAGVLDQGDVALQTAGAFVAFALVSSAVYCVNDAIDIDHDREHPAKRFRPVASGEVSPTAAKVVGGVLFVLSAVVGLLVDPALALVVTLYAVMSVSYAIRLKHVAVVELLIVATGFVLRALAGAAATDVKISEWFFIVTSFGSLLMASGKRHAEALELPEDPATHRPVLGDYPAEFLSMLRTASVSVVLTAYCLWAFERSDEVGHGFPWYPVSIVPFTLAMLRYALLIILGRGSKPEDLVTQDHLLLGAGLAWVLLFGAGVLTA